MAMTHKSHPAMALKPLSTEAQTLAERVAESLRAAIRGGRLAGGELYSVALLADEFDVSRTPVREALLVLERQGMVRFERNRGVRILEATLQDLADIFSLRLMLEVPAARNAARCLEEAGLAALRTELDAMHRAAEMTDEAEFVVHDRNFHDHILSASKNRRLTAVISSLRDHVRERGPATADPILTEILFEHEAILAALEAGDGDRAAEGMRSHLLTTGRILVEQQGGTEADMAWVRWADPINAPSESG
jgi:DNA-binding GntR family transcriptional regulator